MSAFQELHTVLNRYAPIDCDISDLVGRVEQDIRRDERQAIADSIWLLDRFPQNPSWLVDVRDVAHVIHQRGEMTRVY